MTCSCRLRPAGWFFGDILVELSYDPFKDDYEVLRLSQFVERGGFAEYRAGIYSLATNSWRMIDDIDICIGLMLYNEKAVA